MISTSNCRRPRAAKAQARAFGYVRIGAGSRSWSVKISDRRDAWTSCAPFVSVKGYAVPFMQAAERCGTLEYFAFDAFDAMLAKPHGVFLNWPDHDSEPLCSSIEMFADDFGLGFIASVPERNWRKIAHAMRQGDARASVNVTACTVMHVQYGGRPHLCITRAVIDHATIITCGRAVYDQTGVWPTIGGAMTPVLARMAEKWERGRAAWLAARRGQRELRHGCRQVRYRGNAENKCSELYRF